MSYAQEFSKPKPSRGVQKRSSRTQLSSPSSSVGPATATQSPITLVLESLNDSFSTKTLQFTEKRIRIGRQTNQKTAPTESNGYFDSKVLSRTHAEFFVEKGKLYIKDLKSSNGTFLNGRRLSPEGVESEPVQLYNQDVLEFGIDIIGDDNQTVLYKKVEAKVVLSGAFSETRRNSIEAGPKRTEQKSNSFIEKINSHLEYEIQNSREESSQLTQVRNMLVDLTNTLEEKNYQVQQEETVELKRQLRDASKTHQEETTELRRQLREASVKGTLASQNANGARESDPSRNSVLPQKVFQADPRQKALVQQFISNKNSEILTLKKKLETTQSQLQSHLNHCRTETEVSNLATQHEKEFSTLEKKFRESQSLLDYQLEQNRINRQNYETISQRLQFEEERARNLTERCQELEKQQRGLPEGNPVKKIPNGQERFASNGNGLDSAPAQLEKIRELEKVNNKLRESENKLQSQVDTLQLELQRLKELRTELTEKERTSEARIAQLVAENQRFKVGNDRLNNRFNNILEPSSTEQLSQKGGSWRYHKKKASDPVKDSELTDDTRQRGITSEIVDPTRKQSLPINNKESAMNRIIGSLVSFLLSSIYILILYIVNYMRRSSLKRVSVGVVVVGIGLYTYYKLAGGKE